MKKIPAENLSNLLANATVAYARMLRKINFKLNKKHTAWVYRKRASTYNGSLKVYFIRDPGMVLNIGASDNE